MKEIKIGIIGFGTVGSGVHNIIQKNAELIALRSDVNLKIKTICDLDIDSAKSQTQNITITNKWEDITNDEEIDVVVELIGGIEPAKSIAIAALKAGKGVVTANKKLLAESGSEIFDIVNNEGAKLGFEAAIGGGIPGVLSLKTGLVANEFKSIIGILNGTTNYILSKMEELGLSFETILKDAQELGFAEADPTFDIEGYDAGHKIALLAMLAYHKKVDYSQIPIEGITKISAEDIEHATEMGYRIKLLGIAKPVGDKLDIRVHPTMIPLDNQLSSVKNEYNAMMFDCDMTDPILLYGKGAGSNPTASAVVSDIVQIAEKKNISEKSIVLTEDAQLISSDERESRYYLRIHTKDEEGILSLISGILGSKGISIASMIQKDIGEDEVPLLFTTHTAKEKGLLAAIKEIEQFDFIKRKIVYIRIEG